MPRLFLAVLLLCLCGPSWALTPAPLDRDELRLSLAPAATVDQGRIQVISAFGRSRGAVLTLAATGVVLAAPAVILVIAIGYVRAIAGFSEGALIPQLVSVALLFFYLIPVWTAALVEVYRRQPAPIPGTLRT